MAIELAAARMKLFPPQIILEQLEDRFNFLKGGPRDLPERHHTLKNAIDWSYNLLSNKEKIFLNRLAIFEGGTTIEAAEQICCQGISLDVLDGFGSLLSKNLIYQVEGVDGEMRFLMLETIQEYARERLIDSGEENKILTQHAEYFTFFSEVAEGHTRGGSGTVRWLKKLQADHDNLSVVFDRSIHGGDVNFGLRLVGALDYFWLRACFFDEGDIWTNQVLDIVEEAPLKIRASVYSSIGMVKYYLGDISASKSMYQKALNLYQEIGDKKELGWVYALMMYPSQGNSDEDDLMNEYFDTAMDYFNAVGDKAGMCQALALIGVHHEILKKFEESEKAIEESNIIAREIKDEMRICYNMTNKAYLLMSKGDAKLARVVFKEGLVYERNLGLRRVWSADTFKALAQCSLVLGEPDRAIVLLGASSALFDRRGIGPFPPVIEEIQEIKAGAEKKIGKEAADRAWSLGRNMPFEKVIAYALEEDEIIE